MLDEEQENNWGFVIALFARYFGWDINYILSLSPCQISLLQEGLNEIIRAENGEVDSKTEFERQKKISEIHMEEIRKSKKKDKDGKVILDVQDLMLGGS